MLTRNGEDDDARTVHILDVDHLADIDRARRREQMRTCFTRPGYRRW